MAESVFEISLSDIGRILNDLHIAGTPSAFSELQRYDYNENADRPKGVRLIVKVGFDDRPPVVVRFRNETGVTEELIEAQSRFAMTLREGGILTPCCYCTDGGYAAAYHLNGYDVTVTAEDFCEGEVTAVDAGTARKTGELLARMHCISEAEGLHIRNRTLFDPLDRNDLYDISVFTDNREALEPLGPALYGEIGRLAESCMEKVSVFRDEPRFAVQGDISLCNLYLTSGGELGVFDFNNSGDNVLYYDAVMQAVFEATLMDYTEEASPEREHKILSAFLNGYDSIRPFTERQREVFPGLYAVLTAFELGRMRYNKDSLTELISGGRNEEIRRLMEQMREDLLTLKEMPLLR